MSTSDVCLPETYLTNKMQLQSTKAEPHSGASTTGLVPYVHMVYVQLQWKNCTIIRKMMTCTIYNLTPKMTDDLQSTHSAKYAGQC